MEGRVNYSFGPGVRSVAPSNPLQATFDELNEAEQLRLQGKLDRAQEICESLVRQYPDYMGALHTLGLIYADKHNYQRALDCFVRAVMLNPRSWNTLTALGGVYLALDAHEMAAQTLERAKLLKPNDPDVLTTLGVIYSEEREFELAKEAFSQAVALEPNHVLAAVGLGLTCSKIGEDTEAASVFEALLKRGMQTLEVLHALTSLPASLVAIDPLVEIDKLVPGQIKDKEAFENSAAFVRAAALDKAARSAEAWQQVVSANRSFWLRMSDERREEREREQATLARMRGTSIRVKANESRDDRYPVSLFILGPSRSGKTSMEKLVATLPGVKRGYESSIVENAVRRAMQSAALLTSSQFEHLPSQLDPQCREIYLDELARRAGSAKVFTNTHPGNINNVGRIAAVFPNVRFIFVKRTLEDTLLRIYMRKYDKGHAYAYDLKAAGDHVVWYYQMMDLQMERFRDIARLIQYEDMAADPATALRTAADLCRLDASDQPPPAVGDDRNCAAPYQQFIAAELALYP
jgi:tetratricopeptide (TPR) repeat protein